ncbi:MAG: A24 family peptidase [Gammaproteobacteria bacterium]
MTMTGFPSSVSFSLLAALLAAAVYTDVKNQRIPNTVTAIGVITGTAMQGWFFGFEGLGTALGGLGVGLIGFLPFYLKGGMGAGDVKLMAAVGTFLGAKLTIIAIAYTLIAGMVFGLFYAAWHGGVRPMLQRFLTTLHFLAVTGTVSHTGPRPNEAAAHRFPFAVSIALGTLSALMWPVF